MGEDSRKVRTGTRLTSSCSEILANINCETASTLERILATQDLKPLGLLSLNVKKLDKRRVGRNTTLTRTCGKAIEQTH